MAAININMTNNNAHIDPNGPTNDATIKNSRPDPPRTDDDQLSIPHILPAPSPKQQLRQQVNAPKSFNATANIPRPHSTSSPYQHTHHLNHINTMNYDSISIKSKIGVEFRRYALKREDVLSFDSFYKKIEFFHQLSAIPFVIFYADPEDFLLPINNDDNLAKAISSAKCITLFNTNCNNSNSNNNNINQPAIFKRPFLKLFVEKKRIFLEYYNGNLTGKYKKGQHFKGFSNLIASQNDQGLRPSIGMPEDFRQVSSIIDVDIVPETCRRVRIVKHGSDRPLGFYIRDGTYKRMNAQGQIELVTGIFISRLVPGGLAESTGLLAVNDEVLEVNGIQVTHGKTLDQVTDMMVANSSNLIITIRPGKINELP